MYKLSETDRHFLWALFSAVGVILFWKGIWEGVGSLPFLEVPFVSLFVGLVMLTFSGLIFREFDPLGGIEKGALKMLHEVHSHRRRKEFTLKYYDSIQRKVKEVKASNMKRIEKNIISLNLDGNEFFIPVHRVKAILRNGKVV